MECFECLQEGNHRAAVGVCKDCSVAVCMDHGTLRVEPAFRTPVGVIRQRPPRRRELLCKVCGEANEAIWRKSA